MLDQPSGGEARLFVQWRAGISSSSSSHTEHTLPDLPLRMAPYFVQIFIFLTALPIESPAEEPLPIRLECNT
jgi:hypothetical protein